MAEIDPLAPDHPDPLSPTPEEIAETPWLYNQSGNYIDERNPPNTNKQNKPFRPLNLTHMTDLEVNTIDSQYVLPGHLQRGQIGFLTGGYASGKTALMLHLCHQAATGGDVLGFAMSPIKVAYLALEDREGVSNRLCTIANQTGQADIFLAQPETPDGDYAPELFFNDDWFQNSVKTLRDAQISLIIVDTKDELTIARSADANTIHEMGAIIARVNKLARLANAGAIILTHPPKHAKTASQEGAISGSETQGNSAYLVLDIQRDREENTHTLTVHKNKNGRDGAKFSFNIEHKTIAHTDQNQWPITVPYVSNFRKKSGDGTPAPRLNDRQKAWWDIIRQTIYEQGDFGQISEDMTPVKKVARGTLYQHLNWHGLIGSCATEDSKTGTEVALTSGERSTVRNLLIQLKGKGLINFNKTQIWLVRE